ncbi:MAG: hypothetical protein QGH42_07660 [Kiritimatiellia bacterium]|jgi:uncharacterized membrane protein YfcA|nr:hypothetical protein [Kiritimatiellia bacterium]MDP6630835.1 hypothetical protein [Kiritimatiellia bacterium]MDP6811286.1 hypothetical protein [Kiritimatiellia bacterium]MDP7024100.1 hypothetical protein [Kiritimatiellia bacterium]
MEYTAAELGWIGLSILLLGMSKGGFPVGVIALPVIPVGVALGYLLVRLVPQHVYRRFIYVVLGVTSLVLVVKALGA